jgi:hypothetical protein
MPLNRPAEPSAGLHDLVTYEPHRKYQFHGREQSQPVRVHARDDMQSKASPRLTVANSLGGVPEHRPAFRMMCSSRDESSDHF